MSPRRELLRHFLDTFFDSEALAVSGEWKKTAIGAVSYTHLTLPTICSV